MESIRGMEDPRIAKSSFEPCRNDLTVGRGGGTRGDRTQGEFQLQGTAFSQQLLRGVFAPDDRADDRRRADDGGRGRFLRQAALRGWTDEPGVLLRWCGPVVHPMAGGGTRTPKRCDGDHDRRSANDTPPGAVMPREEGDSNELKLERIITQRIAMYPRCEAGEQRRGLGYLRLFPVRFNRQQLARQHRHQ